MIAIAIGITWISLIIAIIKTIVRIPIRSGRSYLITGSILKP